MPLPITALYAAILAIILTALAINVTVHRGKLKVPIGQGDNPTMLRMIRIHGNSAEYIPTALLLMGRTRSMAETMSFCISVVSCWYSPGCSMHRGCGIPSCLTSAASRGRA